MPHKNKFIRTRILKRDGYTCQWCYDQPKNLLSLHVHHIDLSGWQKHPNSEEPTNLILLCIKCHGNQHRLNGKTIRGFGRHKTSRGLFDMRKTLKYLATRNEKKYNLA